MDKGKLVQEMFSWLEPGSKGHKFLGSHLAGLFVQQQRFYSGEGRRWIMKQHFKGMPTPEVDLAIMIITITIVINTS